MPFAKWSHYEDAIWVVPLFGWLRMLPPSSPHHNNDYNSKYLLSSYCVLNTVQRAFQGLPHFQQFSEDTNYNPLQGTVHSGRSYM